MTDEIEAQIYREQPCKSDGLIYDGGYVRAAWTPNGFIRRGDRLVLTCKACGHVSDAPIQPIIDKGWGDRPWLFVVKHLKCGSCGSKELVSEAVRASGSSGS